LTVSLPWVIEEVEATRRLFGPRVWDYSVEGSLPTLNALLTYLDEQKLSQRKMKVDELFVPNISPGLTDYLRPTGEGLAGKDRRCASPRLPLMPRVRFAL